MSGVRVNIPALRRRFRDDPEGLALVEAVEAAERLRLVPVVGSLTDEAYAAWDALDRALAVFEFDKAVT